MYMHDNILSDRDLKWYSNRIRSTAYSMYIEETVGTLIGVLLFSCAVGCAFTIASANFFAGTLLGMWLLVVPMVATMRRHKRWWYILMMDGAELSSYTQLLYWRYDRFLTIEELRHILEWQRVHN